MRIEGSAQSVNGFAVSTEAVRAPAQPAAAARDSVTLSALGAGNVDASVAETVPSMISANAGDALAAHSRLDPERALRLLGLLDA